MRDFSNFLEALDNQDCLDFAEAIASKNGITLSDHEERLLNVASTLSLFYLEKYHEWLSLPEGNE